MSDTVNLALRAALQHLLTPLIRMLLRAGIGVGEFEAIVKTAYVQAAIEMARDEAGKPHRPMASRIAVQTGLARAQVAAILKSSQGMAPVDNRYRQRVERVLAGWWNDEDFQESDGTPAALPLRGTLSLTALVKRHSGGGDPRVVPILKELLRVKAIREREDGRYEPLSRTTATVNWSPEGIAAMGEQVHDLIAALAHNMQHARHARYVRRVVNAQLNASFAPLLIRDIEQQADRLCDAVELSVNDPRRTLSPANQIQKAMRVGIEVFVIEAPSAPMPGESRGVP